MWDPFLKIIKAMATAQYEANCRELGVLVCIYNTSIPSGSSRREVEASLGYRARPCLKKNK